MLYLTKQQNKQLMNRHGSQQQQFSINQFNEEVMEQESIENEQKYQSQALFQFNQQIIQKNQQKSNQNYEKNDKNDKNITIKRFAPQTAQTQKRITIKLNQNCQAQQTNQQANIQPQTNHQINIQPQNNQKIDILRQNNSKKRLQFKRSSYKGLNGSNKNILNQKRRSLYLINKSTQDHFPIQRASSSKNKRYSNRLSQMWKSVNNQSQNGKQLTNQVENAQKNKIISIKDSGKLFEKILSLSRQKFKHRRSTVSSDIKSDILLKDPEQNNQRQIVFIKTYIVSPFQSLSIQISLLDKSLIITGNLLGECNQKFKMILEEQKWKKMLRESFNNWQLFGKRIYIQESQKTGKNIKIAPANYIFSSISRNSLTEEDHKNQIQEWKQRRARQLQLKQAEFIKRNYYDKNKNSTQIIQKNYKRRRILTTENINSSKNQSKFDTIKSIQQKQTLISNQNTNCKQNDGRPNFKIHEFLHKNIKHHNYMSQQIQEIAYQFEKQRRSKQQDNRLSIQNKIQLYKKQILLNQRLSRPKKQLSQTKPNQSKQKSLNKNSQNKLNRHSFYLHKKHNSVHQDFSQPNFIKSVKRQLKRIDVSKINYIQNVGHKSLNLRSQNVIPKENNIRTNLDKLQGKQAQNKANVQQINQNKKQMGQQVKDDKINVEKQSSPNDKIEQYKSNNYYQEQFSQQKFKQSNQNSYQNQYEENDYSSTKQQNIYQDNKIPNIGQISTRQQKRMKSKNLQVQVQLKQTNSNKKLHKASQKQLNNKIQKQSKVQKQLIQQVNSKKQKTIHKNSQQYQDQYQNLIKNQTSNQDDNQQYNQYDQQFQQEAKKPQKQSHKINKKQSSSKIKQTEKQYSQQYEQQQFENQGQQFENQEQKQYQDYEDEYEQDLIKDVQESSQADPKLNYIKNNQNGQIQHDEEIDYENQEFD